MKDIDEELPMEEILDKSRKVVNDRFIRKSIELSMYTTDEDRKRMAIEFLDGGGLEAVSMFSKKREINPVELEYKMN